MSVTCDMCKVIVRQAASRANCKSLDQTDHISWQNKSLSIRFYVHLYLYSQNTNLCLNFFVSNTLEWIKLGHIIVQELLLEEQNCNDERLRIMCAGKKICRVPKHRDNRSLTTLTLLPVLPHTCSRQWDFAKVGFRGRLLLTLGIRHLNVRGTSRV